MKRSSLDSKIVGLLGKSRGPLLVASLLLLLIEPRVAGPLVLAALGLFTIQTPTHPNIATPGEPDRSNALSTDKGRPLGQGGQRSAQRTTATPKSSPDRLERVDDSTRSEFAEEVEKWIRGFVAKRKSWRTAPADFANPNRFDFWLSNGRQNVGVLLVDRHLEDMDELSHVIDRSRKMRAGRRSGIDSVLIVCRDGDLAPFPKCEDTAVRFWIPGNAVSSAVLEGSILRLGDRAAAA